MSRAIMPDANNLITVSGLTSNTEYVYTLFAQNLLGQTFFPVTTKPIRLWTKNGNDATGPVVITSDPESITSHEFFLNFAANEPLAKVVITVTPSAGGASKVITFYAPQEGELLKVTGLLADTDYTYTLILTDFSGNITASASQSFHTSVFESDPAELIYNAPVEIKTDEVRIRIKTNERLSRVIISLIPLDTMIPQEITFGGSLSLDREFTLKGLRAGLDYYYEITIIDEAGNTTYYPVFEQFHTRAF